LKTGFQVFSCGVKSRVNSHQLTQPTADSDF